MATSRDRDVVLDPHFFVPSGIVDVRQQNNIDAEYLYDDSILADEGPELQTPTSVIPMPPTSYSIASQRVRIASDGRAVVDVYVEFPDVEGIETIEVAVTTV
jgi:hypothetical protein